MCRLKLRFHVLEAKIIKVAPAWITKQNLILTPFLSYQVSRVTTGPEIRGCRPVLVAFLHFKVVWQKINWTFTSQTFLQDREEVLSKSKLLKTANIYVSEDLSRKTREHRNELFKYMRYVRAEKYLKQVSKTWGLRLVKFLETIKSKVQSPSEVLQTS